MENAEYFFNSLAVINGSIDSRRPEHNLSDSDLLGGGDDDFIVQERTGAKHCKEDGCNGAKKQPLHILRQRCGLKISFREVVA